MTKSERDKLKNGGYKIIATELTFFNRIFTVKDILTDEIFTLYNSIDIIQKKFNNNFKNYFDND